MTFEQNSFFGGNVYVIPEEVVNLIEDTLINGKNNNIIIGQMMCNQKIEQVRGFGFTYATTDIIDLIDKSPMDDEEYLNICEEIGHLLVNKEVDSKLLNFSSLHQFKINDLINQSVNHVSQFNKVDEGLCLQIGRELTIQKFDLLKQTEKYGRLYEEFKNEKDMKKDKKKDKTIEEFNKVLKNMKLEDIENLKNRLEKQDNPENKKIDTRTLKEKREDRRDRKLNRLEGKTENKKRPNNLMDTSENKLEINIKQEKSDNGQSKSTFKWADDPKLLLKEQSTFDYWKSLSKETSKGVVFGKM